MAGLTEEHAKLKAIWLNFRDALAILSEALLDKGLMLGEVDLDEYNKMKADLAAAVAESKKNNDMGGEAA
jgi:hypothetical protein